MKSTRLLCIVSTFSILAIGTVPRESRAQSCNFDTTCGAGSNTATLLGNATSGYGVEGTATSSGGVGVVGLFGTATVQSGWGSVGVYGASTANTGVIGTTTQSANAGGFFYNSGSSAPAIGVYGDSAYGYAVYGATSNGYAIYGEGPSYFNGNVTAASNVSVGTQLQFPNGSGDPWYFTTSEYTLSGVNYYQLNVETQQNTLTGGRTFLQFQPLDPDGSGYPVLQVNGSIEPGSGYLLGDTNNAWASTTTYALHVQGIPYCNGCTAFTNSSDLRLKKNVATIRGALDQLLKLRGVTFEWREPEKHGNGSGMQRGFIAQEVEKIVPEWVGVDEKGFKTLNLTGIEPMLVESLRELKSQNDALQDRVKSLEAGRRPLVSGFGEGGVGLGMALMAGAIVFTSSRRKRSEATRS